MYKGFLDAYAPQLKRKQILWNKIQKGKELLSKIFMFNYASTAKLWSKIFRVLLCLQRKSGALRQLEHIPPSIKLIVFTGLNKGTYENINKPGGHFLTAGKGVSKCTINTHKRSFLSFAFQIKYKDNLKCGHDIYLW